MTGILALCCLLSTAVVVPADWTGFCSDSPKVCSDYCTKKPDSCAEICRDNPSISGCTSTCCQAQTAECLACQAGLTPPEYCKDNRAVDGCDAVCCSQGCGGECTKKETGVLTSTRTCRTKVKNQEHEVRRPRILEMNVEKDCPFDKWFEQNVEICGDCSKFHQPCNDTYMACGGCCGTPWHSLLGININTEHSCDEIKELFLKVNSVTQECEEEAEDDQTPRGRPSFVDKAPGKFWKSEVITAECKAGIREVSCAQAPLKVKFECDDCQNQGSPVLMGKCCDRCVEFAHSLDVDDGSIPDFVKPIVWCSGCNSTKIHPSNPDWPSKDWPEHAKYANYTEAVADEIVLTFIEEEICSLMRPTCPAAPTDAGRRLDFLAGRGLEATPDCLSSAGECNETVEEKRLEELSSQQIGRRLSVELEGFEPEGDCDHFNPRRLPRSSTRAKDPLVNEKPDDSDVSVTSKWGNDSSTSQGLVPCVSALAWMMAVFIFP